MNYFKRTNIYRGIHLLSEKWKKVIASDGKYIE